MLSSNYLEYNGVCVYEITKGAKWVWKRHFNTIHKLIM